MDPLPALHAGCDRPHSRPRSDTGETATKRALTPHTPEPSAQARPLLIHGAQPFVCVHASTRLPQHSHPSSVSRSRPHLLTLEGLDDGQGTGIGVSRIDASRGEEGCLEPIVEGPLQVAGCRVRSALTAALAPEGEFSAPTSRREP